jgi:transglutaminase-like putative cysteine protease
MLVCAWAAIWHVGALALALAASGPLAGEEAARLDPQLPYRAERSGTVTYQVDFSVVVTPPYKTKRLQVWLPLPPSDPAQEISHRELTTFPLSVQPQIAAEPTFGNRFAYFEFANPQGAQIVRHKFTAQVHELRWNLRQARITPVAEWPESFAPYRRSEATAVLVDGRLRKLIESAFAPPSNPLADMTAVMGWAQSNLTYDHNDASLAARSTHALEKRHGHCSDYHSLCAALGRAMGYPTRVTYGINLFPKNSPSHCKLEAYLPPVGWVSFDVSETQKLCAAIEADPSLAPAARARLSQAANERLLDGFRDNTWLLLTRGSEYDLAPPASRKVAVVRTAYIEADGVPLPEPDPANSARRVFSWMTVQKYEADRPVPYPFHDIQTLEPR